MIARLARFFDDRFGSNAGVRYVLAKVFPDHWSFYLGEFALYAFVLLVATGVWLTFVYTADERTAFASVAALSRGMPVGYLMRQVHHWSAVFFVAAIVVHMARIFFTAAYRAPREVNWVVGVLMLILASLTGFTGYSLPDDALSGTGLRIADAVALSMPFVGGWAADALNGGSYPGPLLLPHLYTIHVYFLPVAIAGLLSLHLGMLVLPEAHPVRARSEHVVGRRFWPDYALRTLAAFALTVAVILVLVAAVEINPIEQYGRYHDWIVTNPAEPDWYAAFLDGALRLGPDRDTIFGHPIPPVFWPGVVMPALAFVGRDRLAVDRQAPDRRHRPARRARAAQRRAVAGRGGATLLAAGVVLTLAASDDTQALAFHVPVQRLVWLYRILLPVGSLGTGFLAAAVARQLGVRKRCTARRPSGSS